MFTKKSISKIFSVLFIVMFLLTRSFLPSAAGAGTATNTTIVLGWMNVGAPAFSIGRVSYVSLAMDGNTPYVAYQDYNVGSKAIVMKFNGSSWETVGAPGVSEGYADDISLAMDGSTPYIAYQDDFNGSKATVMKFNGINWEAVGASGISAGSASYTSIAMDGSTPYIAYRDVSNSSKATVMRFNGTGWETVGTPGFTAGPASDISLAMDGSTPYILYKEWGSVSKVIVMRFNGSSWETVGTPGISEGYASYVSLAMDGSTPYVAYQDGVNGFKATVMKFNGSSWESVGTPGFSAPDIYYLSLALDGSTPYVAYKDGANGKATVMRFNGNSWETVGKRGFSAGDTSEISLALDEGIPYVAYKDWWGNGSKATVMKFDAYPMISPSFSSVAANDGWTLEISEYSSRANSKNNSENLLVGDNVRNRQYRSLLYFDTTGFPNNAAIASVTLKIKLTDIAEGIDPFTTHGALLADMAKGFFGKSPLENTDFQAKGAPRPVGSFAPVSGEPGWYEMVMNPANFKYVNLNGVTQFRLRFTKDDDNDKAADIISFYSGDDATNPPQLIVEYYTP